MSIVAINVKRLISEKGLKQKHVARLAGISEGQMSAMMNGRKIIADTDIVRFTVALGVTCNDLFSSPDTSTPPTKDQTA